MGENVKSKTRAAMHTEISGLTKSFYPQVYDGLKHLLLSLPYSANQNNQVCHKQTRIRDYICITFTNKCRFTCASAR